MREAARALGDLHDALERAEIYATRPMRDTREPGRGRKQRAENRLERILLRHWRRQARRIRARLKEIGRMAGRFEADPLARLADDDALYDDEKFIAELTLLLTKAAQEGVSLFGDNVSIGLDYTLTNVEAAAWAQQYAGELAGQLDTQTREAVRSAVTAFIETPGMSLGDVMDLLPLDEVRAARVSITEITRAYAQGNQVAGEQLAQDFPGVRVLKTWHTSNDEYVCEICEPLNGESVNVENLFPSRVIGAVENPPAHVNCRCWTMVTTEIE